MSAFGDSLEKTISQIEDMHDDWEDVDTEEFDMEAYWDADNADVTWEWESPWSLEPIASG